MRWMTWRTFSGTAVGRGIDLDGVPEGSWGRIQKMIQREAGPHHTPLRPRVTSFTCTSAVGAGSHGVPLSAPRQPS